MISCGSGRGPSPLWPRCAPPYRTLCSLQTRIPGKFFHTPDKTLVVLIKLKEKELNYRFGNFDDYADYYKSVINDSDLMSYSPQINNSFNDSVIYNNYEDFIKRTYHIIMGRLKE